MIWRGLDSFTQFLLGVGVLLAGVVVFYLVRTEGREFPPDRALWVPGGIAARGPDVIETYGCGSCHQIPGIREAMGTVGPELTGLQDKQFIAGQLRNTPENLVAWVMSPRHIDPQTAMPDLGLSEAEARHVAAYLYSVD